MDFNYIDDYIDENCEFIIENRAKKINTFLIEQSKHGFVFKCKGSAGNLYEIHIDITPQLVSDTTCNCPYDYDGICKHIVASLMSLKKMLISGVVTFYQPDMEYENTASMSKPKLKGHEILLINDLIPIKELDRRISKSYYANKEYLIEQVTRTSIKTRSNNWNSIGQTFTFNPENQILSSSCSCTSAQKWCEHRLYALEKFVSVYDVAFFSAEYINNSIEEHLKVFGFSIHEPYEDFFDVVFTPKGLRVVSKFQNVLPSEQVVSITNPEQAILAQLPTNTAAASLQKGIGLCFEKNNSNFFSLFPILGKYNKAKTDFSSGIEELQYFNLEYNIDDLITTEDQFFVLNVLKLSSLIQKNKEITFEYIVKLMTVFTKIIPELPQRFLYSNRPNDSYARKNLSPLVFKQPEIKLFFVLTETDMFYNLKAKIRIDDNNFNINAQKLVLSPLFIFEGQNVYPITNADLSYHILTYADTPETNYFKRDFKRFNENILIPLSKKFEIQQKIFKKNKQTTPNKPLEKHVYIKDLDGAYILFDAFVQYDKQLVPLFSNEMLLHKNHENITYLERDESFEDQFLEEIKSLHPDFENQNQLFYLTPEQLFDNYWMLQATEKMKLMGFKVFGANDLKSFKYNMNKPVISIGLKSDIDWFDLELQISFGNQKVDLKELQKSYIKKSNFVALSDGTVGILPEDWLQKFGNYFKAGEIKKNSIQISNYQFGIIDELYHEVESKPSFLKELFEKKQRLQHLSEIANVASPKGLQVKLRDYQQHGLNWLVFLHQNQLGGCLADDMGLGKTLQTIAFLQYLKTTQKAKTPSLIIAPTSLIFNWINEIEKFCPTLKVLPFVGSGRATSTAEFKKYNIVISTYGSLLNDIEFLKDYVFNYVILDESQAIKNPNSKRYKAVRLLQSFNKLTLTGTPIENNTFDLYAQLNFLNPGLLGSMSHFKSQFSDTIDKEKDVESSVLLSKIIAPFVLRRTKEQVAKELPDKTESVIYCDMSKEQRKVYEAFKDKYKDYLLNKIDENGVAKSQMYILEGLTKLRQICNSTELINDDVDYGNYSAKLEILIETIKEKTGNHKILVFSQFVKMLQIVRKRLDDEQITYEYLDGQTQNRQQNVNNFQTNSSVRVFLISLKAGGTGLNLTEADYVFIIDPWWNPALENQAIDRCYRIGQTKQVMAYRMICRDTIEEKIVSLQTKKKAVASSIISIDDEKKSFNIDEVKELFG